MGTVRPGWLAFGLAGLLCACGGTSGNGSHVTAGSSGSGGGGGGGLALGGSGGGSGTGPVAGGGGGPGRAEGPAQWVVFTTPDGFFAYDTHHYPNAGAAIRLGDPPANGLTGTSGPVWSSDGKHLSGVAGDSLIVWDMDGLEPSAGRVLIAGLKRGGDAVSTQWAADNKTVFLKQDKTLMALDSTTAMPKQSVITTSALFYSAAPKGEGLIFDDDTGMNFVSVPAGLPGQPQHAEAINADWTWSPDGVHFGTEGANVKIFDTSGPQLASTDVYPLLRTYASSPSFSHDGSYFAFNAGNGTEALMYGSVAAPAAVKPLNGVMQGSEGRAARWHPKKPLIAYNVAYSPNFEATKEWVIADVSGEEPSLPVAIPVMGDFNRWLPDGTRLLMLDAEHKQLTLVDMEAKPPSVEPFVPAPTGGIAYETVSPDGSVLGYSTQSKIFLADLKMPATPPLSVNPGGQENGTPYFAWTGDGQYLVVNVSSDKFEKASIKVAKVNGRKLSELVTIMAPRSVQGFGWSLQPPPRP
jgi:hypothetical protein